MKVLERDLVSGVSQNKKERSDRMGMYLNPGNNGFRKIRNGEYVDKTGLIKHINRVLDTLNGNICISRPRRFGKSMAAKMLCAYYDKTCDSRELFEDLEIAKDETFEQYLNKYDVIYLDITRFISSVGSVDHAVKDIQKCVIMELQEYYPGCIRKETTFLPNALFDVYAKTGNRFFFIIDEWDAFFRETKEKEDVQKEYIKFLRGLFKGGPATDDTIVGAYMTGILPIKKYGTESALTDFIEYTMVSPYQYAKYVGFTEKEVQKLCEKYDMKFEQMAQWYDGYSFSNATHIYSPNSVMKAVSTREFENYWTQSEAYESLKMYISMNMDGLKDAVIAMLGGQSIEIEPLSFQNDITSMDKRDKVLTLLVHLGYLAYDGREKTVHIPNLEVAESFRVAVEDTEWTEVADALKKSAKLLKETIVGNSGYVAEALERIHETSSSVLQYNDENSLACALNIAYYTAKTDYIIIRELPTGKGFADLAFFPRRYSDKPAMLVELKYNKAVDSAIQQIKEKRYGGELKDYIGNMLLVGINYDKTTKKHSCVIEKA